MCELLGLCFNLPVDPKISFKGFRYRGVDNGDGWGLAFYPDKSAVIIKEPINSFKSDLSQFISEYPVIRSKIFIGHVRRSSVGSISYMNTHPFKRELNGRDYIFAHNGTIYIDRKVFRLGRLKPIGETDSEYIFCYILSLIEDRGIDRWGVQGFKWLREIFRRINRYGTLNCLMSEGQHLFVYRDIHGYKSLKILRRAPPYRRIHLKYNSLVFNLDAEKDPRQRGYIIATEALTDEDWLDLPPGELYVFRDGELIFPTG